MRVRNLLKISDILSLSKDRRLAPLRGNDRLHFCVCCLASGTHTSKVVLAVGMQVLQRLFCE